MRRFARELIALLQNHCPPISAVRLAYARARYRGEFYLCDECQHPTRRQDLQEVWMLCADLCPRCCERFQADWQRHQEELQARLATGGVPVPPQEATQ